IVHRTALAGAAMARETSVSEIDTLSVGSIAGRSILCQRRRARFARRKCYGNQHCNACGPGYEEFHDQLPQRGSVTTSMTAGWRALTTAIARWSAGPRSFGSMIGPSPYTPKPRARVAQSPLGSVMVMPVAVLVMPRP